MQIFKKLGLAVLCAAMVLGVVACGDKGSTGEWYIDVGNSNTPAKSSACELSQIKFYVNNDDDYSSYIGTISGTSISVVLPTVKKTSEFYIVGTMSDKASLTWDGTEKNLEDSFYVYTSDKVSFDNSDNHTIVVTAEDGESKNTYTLTASWEYFVGDKVAVLDIFGNAVSGYIAYKRVSNVYDTTYYDSESETGTSIAYSVVDADGLDWKYLIVNTGPVDAKWASGGTSVSGTSRDIGAGKSNSEKIMKACSNSIAKTLYDTKNMYLPSMGEMNLIARELSLLESTISKNYYYWTSTQVDDENVYTFDCLLGLATSRLELKKTSKTSASKKVNVFGDIYYYYYGIGVSYLPE